jgi:Pyruvate/2-oxoglutarate dehydrogenase complex, dehydrogenase (E1) component, eukaryotic type, beta subunit
MTKLTLSRGLNEGLRKALENDPKVLIMGEDVGKLGGVFRSPTACRRTSARPG